MIKKVAIALLLIILGYSAGENRVMEDDVVVFDEAEEVTGTPVRIEYEYKTPGVCLDTISLGLSTNLKNTANERQYREMAYECHEAVGEEFEVDDMIYKLPEPTVVVIPDRPESINPNTGAPITNEEYDDAFLDCLDEEGLDAEEYCDDNYEDWLSNGDE